MDHREVRPPTPADDLPPGLTLPPPVHDDSDRRPARIGCVAFLIILLTVGGYFGWRFEQQQLVKAKKAELKKAKASHEIPVAVAKAFTRAVPIELKIIGSVLPYQTVPVTSQVGGQILKLGFKQGDYVRQGQLLFQIDPRPLEAALQQARANILRDRAQISQALTTVEKDAALVKQAHANTLRDRAQLTYAIAESNRYTSLLHQGYVTAEQAEQQVTNARSLRATVASDVATEDSVKANMAADEANVRILQANLAADEAAERNAVVQLGYTTINAPLAGRTGALTLYQGAVVVANSSSPLITIDQVSPVYVNFAVPEQYLAQIRKLQRNAPLSVQAAMADTPGPPESGRVSFIDNTVDVTTGTIAIRGTFPNLQHRLWPGRYVNVMLLLGETTNATLVPEEAVQPGQNGDYVFVVKPGNTVETRDVKVERTVGGYSVITSGIKVGETVVTDNQFQLVQGAKITLKTAEDKSSSGNTHRGKGASASPAAGGSGEPTSGSTEPSAAPSSQSPTGEASSSTSDSTTNSSGSDESLGQPEMPGTIPSSDVKTNPVSPPGGPTPSDEGSTSTSKGRRHRHQ